MSTILWAIFAVAALNVFFQVLDTHTTSELIKRSAAQEATAWMARHLNNNSITWARRFWALVVVKLLCVAAVVFIAALAWYFPAVWSPAFLVMELWLAWLYGRQMQINWALYQRMLKR